MAYSTFSLAEIKTQFHITLIEDQKLFDEVKPLEISDTFVRMLEYNAHLALAIDTEKARSEFIIAPVLAEHRRMCKSRISLFSGVDFTVDPQHGLSGTCDFIISRSPEQFYITAPVIIIVEAKNDRITNGLPQCLAEMVAAQLFNTRMGTGVETVYGIVSTGSLWRCLKLAGTA
ncbi:MAG: hypothetical protein FJZ47_23635, partial [Candidatus Tectomicrobia bacterium]|nr:hypothetical protein [Candidatus Tectomicrobia bacterium]